jgi:hypothetical protein
VWEVRRLVKNDLLVVLVRPSPFSSPELLDVVILDGPGRVRVRRTKNLHPPATNLCCASDSVSLAKDTTEQSGTAAEDSGSYWVINVLLTHTFSPYERP